MKTDELREGSSMARRDQQKQRNLFWRLGNAPQPFSPVSVAKHSRLEGATAVNSVCPYCAVGCAQLAYVKNGKCIDIEGDPRSPINEGTLCPKGANTFQLNHNPHRPQQVLYRAPYSDHWEERPLDWAMDRIAQLTKETRDATFIDRDDDGNLVRHTTAIGHLGGATLDNEENYLIKKLFSTLGIVSIENQARI
jgi:formate dehydrogenase major subunit